MSLVTCHMSFWRCWGVLPHAWPVAPCPSQHESSAARLFQPDASPEIQTHRDQSRRQNTCFWFWTHISSFGKSTWFNPKVYCKQTKSKLSERWISWRLKSHNSFFECDELLFFLLPALKVGIDQGLQLDQVFVLAFLLDVLSQSDTENTLLCYLHLNPNCKQVWSKASVWDNMCLKVPLHLLSSIYCYHRWHSLAGKQYRVWPGRCRGQLL